MKNITWVKSAEISCEVGVVKMDMIISVDNKIAERLVTSGFLETKRAPTHEKDDKTGKWVEIEKPKKKSK